MTHILAAMNDSYDIRESDLEQRWLYLDALLSSLLMNDDCALQTESSIRLFELIWYPVVREIVR